MTAKIELASPEWFAALKAHIERFVQTPNGQKTNWSICEVFTGVPKHLDRDGTGVIAWHCRIADGKMTFAYGAADDVEMKTTTDYDFILPMARLIIGPDTAAELAAHSEKGIATGKMKREGVSTGVPPEFHAIHNDLAAITA